MTQPASKLPGIGDNNLEKIVIFEIEQNRLSFDFCRNSLLADNVQNGKKIDRGSRRA
ncbi:MAG TPA: hypothetical protein VGM30_17110 [Puia sp.]|jgi:hypothetical protein